MKVLMASHIREADAYTIRHEPIASIDLMERASKAFANWFVSRFDTQVPVSVVCGTGNNGGDGLAIARLLIESRYNVRVFVIRVGASSSPDFDINLERLNKLTTAIEVDDPGIISNTKLSGVLIDAIFGYYFLFH